MKVIFAQGNPGKQYERTRHNIGFITLDALAAAAQASWKTETKFKASLATVTIDGEKVLLVKPLTYYNETGLAARALVDFYKLTPSTDFLAIHDDLALPFGTIRIREQGSGAGNNGIKSLNAHLGPNYPRIRIGIWNELRDRMSDADFVLSQFSKAEAEQIDTLIATHITPAIHAFIDGTLEPHSQRLSL